MFEKELKPETIKQLNQYYLVDVASSGSDYYMIHFVNKNNKYSILSIFIFPNDVYNSFIRKT